jgi:hypothetical protein
MSSDASTTLRAPGLQHQGAFSARAQQRSARAAAPQAGSGALGDFGVLRLARHVQHQVDLLVAQHLARRRRWRLVLQAGGAGRAAA